LRRKLRQRQDGKRLRLARVAREHRRHEGKIIEIPPNYSDWRLNRIPFDGDEEAPDSQKQIAITRRLQC
jgi:hypothetical protein